MNKRKEETDRMNDGPGVGKTSLLNSQNRQKFQEKVKATDPAKSAQLKTELLTMNQ